MLRFRLLIALTLLAGGTGNAHLVVEGEILDKLAPAYATNDPARLAVAFRAMGDYGKSVSGAVESSINAMGYRHLKNGEIDMAIAVFELNTDTFPQAANTWDSLAEAIMAKGDHEKAIRYYRRSLELDPDNSNAARMIARIKSAQQLSHETRITL